MSVLILVFVLAMAMWGLRSIANGVTGASDAVNKLADRVEARRNAPDAPVAAPEGKPYYPNDTGNGNAVGLTIMIAIFGVVMIGMIASLAK